MSENQLSIVAIVGSVVFSAVLYVSVMAMNNHSERSFDSERTARPTTPTAVDRDTPVPVKPVAVASDPTTPDKESPAKPAGAPPVAPPGGVSILAAKAAQMPGLDPAAPAWANVPATEVMLLPQVMAKPTLDKGTIPSASVQCISDGKQIAWRLTWKDPEADMNVDAGRFTDAVALQFPLTPHAAFTMGVKGMKVQILHWKALWQKDIDEHFQDVQDLHPNYWTDFYWFATPVTDNPSGAVRYRVPDSFGDGRSHAWFTGLQAGNPMSAFDRKYPVEELVAEGYGTLTHQPESVTTARGVWRDGRWTVVFARPLATDDKLDYQITPGKTHQIALAVWDGGTGNVGGRKHWSAWVNFEVKP